MLIKYKKPNKDPDVTSIRDLNDFQFKMWDGDMGFGSALKDHCHRGLGIGLKFDNNKERSMRTHS